MTQSTYIKDLKKGQKVSYYGATFEILEDATSDTRQYFGCEPVAVPSAPCKRIDTNVIPSLDGILTNYDFFQGQDRVAVII